jgi:hypothetical protein
MSYYQQKPGSGSNKPNADIVSFDFSNAQDDKIYFNIAIPNSIPSSSVTQSTRATYESSVSPPLLDKPGDYYVAIQRFQIPAQLIPLVIAQFRTDPIVPNETIWSITLIDNVNEVLVQSYVVWEPQALLIIGDPTLINYCYNYSAFLNMINTAINTAVGSLTVAPPVGFVAPYFQFEIPEQRVSLVAQKANFAGDSPNYSLAFNGAISGFFTGIPSLIQGFNAIYGIDYIFNITDNYNNSYFPSDTPQPLEGVAPFLIMTQQYPALGNWNALQSIVITSNLLPVRKETTPGFGQNSGGVTTSQAIVADFIPLLNQNEYAVTTIEYVPPIHGQLINLQGDQPLDKISVEMLWTDKYTGQLHPIYVPFGQVATIKFGFFKKKTFTS